MTIQDRIKKFFNYQPGKGGMRGVQQAFGKKVLIEVMPPPRSFVDIGRYVQAVKSAESIVFPNRIDLYDIYQESIDYDAHLRTVIEKRVSNVLNRTYTYVDKSGNEIEKVREWMEAPKFRAFMQDIIETQLWGYSLFEYKNTGGWFDYELISRKNVDPLKKIVKLRQQDQFGIAYDKPPYRSYVMGLGDPMDLGLMKTAARYAIYKRNMLSDWASYSEIAGNNFMVYKYEGEDKAVKDQIDFLMKEGGAGMRIRTPQDVDFDVKSASSTSTNDLFEGFHDALNKEISKLILHQTMTTEGGQSRSQAEVHKTEQDSVEANDLVYLLNALNYEFSEYRGIWSLPEGRFVQRADTAVTAMIKEIGQPGVKAMTDVLMAEGLTPEQKKQVLIIVFGLQEPDAKSIIGNADAENRE